MRSSLLFAVTLVSIMATTAHAAPIGTIDQQNLAAAGRFFSGQNQVGQSFLPTLTGIDAIQFDLGALSLGPSTYFVNLRDGLAGANGLAGPILGTSNSIILPADEPIATRHFDFASTIALTPGNKYVAEVVGNNGVAGALSIDSYPQGEGLVALNPGWDMIFTEGLHVPEPATGMLAAFAACWLLNLASGRRR